MNHRTIAAVIGLSYVALTGVWAITRRGAVRAFSHQPPLSVPRGSGVGPIYRDQAARTAGVLWVFIANMATVGLFVGSVGCLALAARLPRLRVSLPHGECVAGMVLYLLDVIWCSLVLIYNPGYRPCFLRPTGMARLATRGPYALVRHPRYTGEATMNVILVMFTGAWLSLLGVLGWPALWRQAQLEEEWLLRAAPDAYREYSARAGRFLPQVTALGAEARAGRLFRQRQLLHPAVAC